MDWKTRNDPNKPSMYGQHYQERPGLRSGTRRKGSGAEVAPQTRSVDSMKAPQHEETKYRVTYRVKGTVNQYAYKYFSTREAAEEWMKEQNKYATNTTPTIVPVTKVPKSEQTLYKCPDCGHEFSSSAFKRRCPNCKSLNIERKLPDGRWIKADAAETETHLIHSAQGAAPKHEPDYYRRMYLTQLREERKYAKSRGWTEEVKKIDAELVRRANDRVAHKSREDSTLRMKRQLQKAHYRDSRQLLQQIHRENYSNLTLYEETDHEKLKAGNYKYVITSGAMSHTAFHTEAGLNKWMHDSGIKKGEKISHLHSSWRLKGHYSKVSMSGNAEKLDGFAKKKNLRSTEVLDNGEYTRGYVKEGKTGNVIYHLNPNYPREHLPYKHQ